MKRIEWWPAPREGEIVPDHPPADLTPYIVAGSFTAAGSRQAMVAAAMRYDEMRAAALAAGFTEQQWDQQLDIVNRTQLWAPDVPDAAFRLLLEFGEPTEPVQAERRRFMNRLRDAAILRDPPAKGVAVEHMSNEERRKRAAFEERVELVTGLPYADAILIAEEQERLQLERLQGAGFCCEAGAVAAPDRCPWHPEHDNPDPYPWLGRPTPG